MQYLLFVLGLVALLSGCVYVSHAIEQKRSAHRESQRKLQRQLSLDCNPLYQASLEGNRRHELATRKMNLDEQRLYHDQHKLSLERDRLMLDAWKVKNWLDVGQHGAYRINEDGSLLALPPLTRLPALQAKAGNDGAATAAAIPAPYDMREVWASGFRPSRTGLWLAKSATSEILVPWQKLLHSIACGPTGGGKTNIVRLLMTSLCYIGFKPVLMDIHFAPIKEDEQGNLIDWRPFLSQLAQPPIYQLDKIIAWMQWCAYTELENRITRQREGQPIGAPIFFHIAELPATLEAAGDDLADPLAKLLRQGRQYHLFFFGDSQDLLTSTLKMTSGPRECFRTGFYVGGDPTTAKVLLDIPKGESISEEGLGQQGLCYVKTAIHSHTLARVGWMSNDALYDLFETPTHDRLSTSSTVREVWDFSHMPRTEHQEPGDTEFEEVPDGPIIDADPLKNGNSTNIRDFSKNGRTEHQEPLDWQSQKVPTYRLPEDKIDPFIAAYKASNSMEKALASVGHGSRYKEHARQILAERGLRKEA